MILRWFREAAPIQTKMRVLTLANILLAAAAIVCAGRGDGTVLSPWLGGAVAMLFVMLCLNLVAGRAIAGSYVATVVRMEALAAGDLTSPIRFTDYKDCVGRMTTAMQVFRDGAVALRASETKEQVVRAISEALSQVADGNLAVRLTEPFTPEYEPLRSHFNAAMDALGTTLSAVSRAAAGIRTGSTEISAASDALSHRTEQQAASLEQTAAAMDEITATVRETANGAARANDAVAASHADAENGGRIVREAIGAMAGIERASAEIADILSVIDGIAFQTNLLALNAGVEAARAGDAGRGFAVVAAEVRALAQRSADAARDVKGRIMSSNAQVKAGVTLVGETGRALDRIVDRVGEVTHLVAAIARSAEQQSQGLHQVNIAVNEMDGMTQQNAAMVEESTAAARSLAAEADAMADHVARFRLTGRDRPAAAPPARIVHPIRATVPRGHDRGHGALARRIEPDTDDWSGF